MSGISVRVEGPVDAPPADVYRYLADMVHHHPHILPDGGQVKILVCGQLVPA